MKHKIAITSGLGIAMLVSLLLPVPASADMGYWSAEPIPGTTGVVLGPAGIDVCDIAVATDGTTVYAVPGDSVSESIVYKSTDAGTSWEALGANVEADLVAVAPDDTDMVAIARSNPPAVYITINGGSTWHELGTPQESGGGAAAAVSDIAISKAIEGVHYIAAAGQEAGNVANVWYYKIGTGAPAWKETNSLPDFGSAHGVKAVAFSPNFPSDEVMVAISEKAASIDLQILSLSSLMWNASAGFANYPTVIVSNGGITGLASASLALAPDYLASEPSRRTAFIGLTVDGSAAASATSGIYRLNNTTKKELKTGTRIHSIAYNGTDLVAGEYDSNVVHRSADPLATTPTVSEVYTEKGPGGENRVVVARAGSKVVAGTSGNESAFAVSRNNGASFNDISLIDTAIVNARDVAASDDGRIYLVTDDGNDLSLWRRVSAWERVLSQPGTADGMVRLSPEDADVIYLAGKHDTIIYYSESGGEAAWYPRTCRVNIQDLVVESGAVIYALDSAGYAARSINAGFTWGAAVSTRLDSGATIVSAGTNNLLAGSQDGYVAYSSDGSTSWTKISRVLQSGAGDVQVTADEGFATNRIIYAASDTAGQDIKKWQIGTSTAWTDIFRNFIPGGIYGLVTEEGVLYALEFNSSNGQSTLWQCLTPTTASSGSSVWSSSATTTATDTDDNQVHLNATPRALKASSGKLWAVKTNGTNKLYSLNDILIEIKGWKPASGFVSPVNSTTGIAHDIGLNWSRPSDDDIEDVLDITYDLDIAGDKDFNTLITTITVASEESNVFVLVGPSQTGPAKVNFLPGQSYYWRVRTTQPLYSYYSQVQYFTIEPLMALVPTLLTPANGSTDASRKPSFSWNPVSGASEYRLVLGDNAELTLPIVDARTESAGFAMTEELDYGRTYFWKVRATEPVVSDWSALANFSVEEEPAAVLPPVVPQVSTPEIDMPELSLPPTTTVTVSPLPTETSAISDYLRVIIIIAAVLLLAVLALIIKLTSFEPPRVAEGFGSRLGNLRDGLANYLQYLNPRRTFGAARAHMDKAAESRTHPISFAAASFLWMMTPGEAGESTSRLSADEEEALGRVLASRIQALARDEVLYQKFPGDAALFLHIWSHYGSRDETDRYLTGSFQSKRENVVEFLRCYLTTPRGAKPEPDRKTGFKRTHYDSVAAVVDPDNVYEALARLYGPDLEAPKGEPGSDRAIAFQFARLHRLVRSEREKAGAVRADTG